MALLNTNIGPERVQVFPRPLGNVPIAGAGISTAAIVISTSEVGAPENVATPITSLEQFTDTFGGPDEVANGAYYAVKGFFDNAGEGNTAWIVNVGATPTVSDYIGNASDNSGLRAFDAIDDVGLVMVPGLPLAEAYLVQSAAIDYTEVIRAEFGATLSTSFTIVTIPKEVTTAEFNKTLLTTQLIGISGSGPWVMDIQVESTATAATGTVTIVDYSLLGGAVITVAGTALTEGVEWTASVSNNDTATSLASAINALVPVNAASAAAVVTVTAVALGVAGNSITLVTDDAVNAPVSGATLSGGTAGNADLSVITAGMIVKNSAGTYTGIISQVNNSTDTVTVTPDPSTFFTAGDDVILAVPSAVTYKNSVVSNAQSKAAAWYYNQAVVVDESSAASPGDVIVVDPSGHVAGMIARIDANTSIGGPSHAPAGQQYAGLVGLNGLAYAISERKDAAPLRLNFINRITTFPGSGPVVFGGYTADSGVSASFTADEQLIQVIRTLQFLKASLEPGLRAFLWENFSPDQQARVVAATEAFLRNNSYLFPAGLPESSQFKVIGVEPTQNELDQGLLRVRVQVRPNKAIRFIEIALEFPLPEA
jgi:hypothetical protein